MTPGFFRCLGGATGREPHGPPADPNPAMEAPRARTLALGRYTAGVTRQELIDRTRALVEEGERLVEHPSLGRLRFWLKVSDDLLSAAWGTMDRYHLAWLMVGRPKDVVRGRPMTPEEEAAYVREVARAKTAALRMSLDALERLGIPFLGDDGRPTASESERAGSLESPAASDDTPAASDDRPSPPRR